MNTLIDVLYEDNHLLVVNKPSGLLTQPSGTEQDSLEQRAKEWIKVTYQKPGNVFLEAVHRLDKPASGIIVFGRTSKALSRLNESIRDKKTVKTYLALVEGRPPKESGELENYMVHDDYHAQIVSKSYPQAKIARLSYKTVKQFNDRTLLEINLETGRYHQIRLQLAEIGCPIIGDTKYGAKVLYTGSGIALHHGRLQFPHPVKQEIMTIEAPLPADFNKLL
ncbi:MAG: RluA family pseudouridine synthase [Parachlamydiaceae bacterium]|nr:RluA family pseudouridine synthase [Parachlamydiaceae bacterium]